MKNFLKFAWAKRKKVWRRRDLVVKAAGRQTVRWQYRVSGLLAKVVDRLGLAVSAEVSGANDGVRGLRKAANPFIEFEVGRLRLDSAPIATTVRETYAQCNEDIIVESILRAVFSSSGRDMSTLRYLEVGGNHPVQTSSSYLFYRAWGAQGFIVEANAALASRLKSVRPRDLIIQTAVSDSFDKTVSFYVHELDELSSLSASSIRSFETSGVVGDVSRVEVVPNMHISALFDAYIDTPLDFMSIDIEGLDLPVLKALDPRHRPTVLQVECPADLPLLNQLKCTLEPRGYQLVAMTEVNVIFVQRDAVLPNQSA